ncbi:MAG: deaminase [Betaproteobacteria bacterium]
MADNADGAPKVWLDLDQAALDRAYDQAQHAPNMQQVLKRYELSSERARERLGQPSRHAYGPSAAEALDCFCPGEAQAPSNPKLRPALLFIHGGAWRGGLARHYAFVAEPFVAAGYAVLIPDFAPVTELDGDLGRMTDQIRRAIAWVASNAAALGIDPARVHLFGHSSGGHLAAAALATDWRGDFSLASNSPIASLSVCSGIYDLLPVRLSARGNYLRLTDEQLERLSPVRHLSGLSVPLTVAWGSLESPEFQRQAQHYADAAQAQGVPVTRLTAEGYNHFEILETLANPCGLLGRAMLGQIAGGHEGRAANPAPHRIGSAEAATLPSAPGTLGTDADPDRHWMRLALAQSQEAFERGDWPTGAVLVRDGKLLATGQNRQVSQCDLTVHAESDVIRRAIAAHGVGVTQGATLYCTMEPCPMCAGALKNAGVSRVVLALRHARLRRTDLGRYTLEAFSDLTGWTPELRSGVLEEDYLALRLRWGRDPVRTD